MRDRYSHATVVTLETNYRSTRRSLPGLTAGGEARWHPEDPRSRHHSRTGAQPARTTRSEDAEVAGIITRIKELVRNGISPGDIAVLYRINARSTAFEHGLHREQVPFQVADGGFVERQGGAAHGRSSPVNGLRTISSLVWLHPRRRAATCPTSRRRRSHRRNTRGSSTSRLSRSSPRIPRAGRLRDSCTRSSASSPHTATGTRATPSA